MLSKSMPILVKNRSDANKIIMVKLLQERVIAENWIKSKIFS